MQHLFTAQLGSPAQQLRCRGACSVASVASSPAQGATLQCNTARCAEVRSHYTALCSRFEPCDMEGLMRRFDAEFAYYNLTLAALAEQGVEIHWTEVRGGSLQGTLG